MEIERNSSGTGKWKRAMFHSLHARSQKHLLPPIRRLVRRGSKLWTDKLSTYACLREEYRHTVVNHSKRGLGRFMAPDGTCTNSVEGL